MNKNILFVCPKFYNYHVLIINNLIEKGYNVTFLPDLAEDRLIFAFYKKFQWFKKLIHFSFNNKIQNYLNNNEYSTLFVIKGKLFTNSLITKLNQNKNFKNVFKIMYQWDSDSSSNYSNLITYFDKVLTFDPKDSVNFRIDYLPLFCSQKVKSNLKTNYDMLVISSYTKERNILIKKIIYNKLFHSLRFKIFIYQPFLSYIKTFIKNENLPFKYVSFSKISMKKYFDELSKTKAVLDISHSYQSGLSMRTIETLGNDKKLFTNNKQILNENFYNNLQIKVFENINEIFDKKFIENSHNYKNNIDDLMLKNWIDRIIT